MKRHGIFFTGMLAGVGVFYLAAWLLALPAALRPPSTAQKMMKAEMMGGIIRNYLAYDDYWSDGRPKDLGQPLYLTNDILAALLAAIPTYSALETQNHVLGTPMGAIFYRPPVESQIPREVFGWGPSSREPPSDAYSNIRLWLTAPAPGGVPANPAHPEFWIALQCDQEVKVWVDGEDWMSPQALAAKLGEQIEKSASDQAQVAFLREQIQYLNSLANHS